MTTLGKVFAGVVATVAVVWLASMLPFSALWPPPWASEERTPTPIAATATPQPTPVPAAALTAGEPAPFPEQHALFLLTNSGAELERLYLFDGRLRRDSVLRAPEGGALAPASAGAGGGVLLVAACNTQPCGADAGTMQRSDDAGATWGPADSSAAVNGTTITVAGSSARWDGARLLTDRGALLLVLETGRPLATLADEAGERVAVLSRDGRVQRLDIYVARPDAAARYGLAHSFTVEEIELVAWVGERLLVAAPHPALIDAVAGSMHAVEPYGRADAADAVRLVAAIEGPFARVEAGPGDCLFMRRAPGTDAEILDCVPTGALVRVLERPSDSGWALVARPSGASGWSSAQYLELGSLDVEGQRSEAVSAELAN